MSTVSVIVPCYNAEKTVRRTLNSLAAQTFKDFDIIAINDGSTDETLSMLKRWQEENPDTAMEIYDKKNEGIAAARNFGLAKVTGKYFAWLDSDDWCEPDMLADMVAKAEADNLQIVVSSFIWVNSKGEKIQKEGPYGLQQDMMVNLFAVLWNKLYRTDFIKSLDVRFPDGCRYEDDCFLYCLVCHVEKIGFLDKAYVHYMQVGNSITHTSNDQVKNMIAVFQIIVQYYKDHGLFEEYHDALEYLHIKHFLGSNFLRSCKIPDKEERKNTILLGWNLLNDNFPSWHENPYLKTMPGLKHKYFRIVNRHNLMFFAWLFNHFVPDNL